MYGLLDKIHGSLGVCHCSIVEKKKKKKRHVRRRRQRREPDFWLVSLISLVRSFSLHTSTIISARGSKWPFCRKRSYRKQCLKKRGNLRSSFYRCLVVVYVRGRFLSALKAATAALRRQLLPMQYPVSSRSSSSSSSSSIVDGAVCKYAAPPSADAR